MITISPLFRVPFIVIAVGLHHHVLSPRSWSRRPIEGFQQKNESISEKTIFSNVAISTGLQQVSRSAQHTREGVPTLMNSRLYSSLLLVLA